MHARARSVALRRFAAALALAAAAACGDGTGAPDEIGGTWVGRFAFPGLDPGSIRLVVRQSGEALFGDAHFVHSPATFQTWGDIEGTYSRPALMMRIYTPTNPIDIQVEVRGRRMTGTVSWGFGDEIAPVTLYRL